MNAPSRDAVAAAAFDRGATAHRIALWSLSVTAACLPLYVVRWRVGPLPSTLLEALIGLTAVAYVAWLVVERRPPRFRTAYDIPIVLLLVAGLLGIVAAPDHVKALGTYRAYFLEAVLCFLVAVDVIRSREDLRTFLLVAAAGICAMSIGQIVSFAYVAAHHQLKLGDAPAFLNTSPNPVAMYLEPALAMAIGFVVFATRTVERWIAAVVLSVVFVAIVTTLSRASYLSMSVLAIVLVLSLQSARRRLWAIGGLAVLLLAVLEVPYVNRRLLDFAHSVTIRSSIYHQALQMLSQRPILGAGIDGFPIRVAPFRPSDQYVQLYPHDLWLTTWSEIGLLGVVVFAVIFFGAFVRAARALPKSVDVYRPLLWGVVGAFVLLTVHGLFDSPYWKNDLSVQFWLLVALQVVGARGAPRADAGASP